MKKATPYARKIAAQYHIDLQAVSPSGPDGEIIASDVEKAHSGRKSIREVPVTPLASRIAAEKGIDLSKIRGTGIGGKISKADVLAASGTEEIPLLPGELRVPMSPMRLRIRDQMTKAAQVPTATVITRIDATALLAKRRELKEKGSAVTLNDLILFAVSRTLAKHKRLLCSYDENNVILKQEVNLGVATSVEDGLIVPVVREADLLSLGELSDAVRALVEKARNKTITNPDCEGHTFTVTNLGMYDVEWFTPMLNLPDAAILGVGAAVKEGRKFTMRLCLTYDHRLLDGAAAACFNRDLKAFLERARFEGS